MLGWDSELCFSVEFLPDLCSFCVHCSSSVKRQSCPSPFYRGGSIFKTGKCTGTLVLEAKVN